MVVYWDDALEIDETSVMYSLRCVSSDFVHYDLLMQGAGRALRKDLFQPLPSHSFSRP